MHQSLSRLAIAILMAALSATPSLAIVAPNVGDAQIRRPLPLPYDEQADADAQIAKATVRARRAHKLLLLDLGGNWCLDCRVLAAVMNIPVVAGFVKQHYELVSIDIGRMDKNQQVPAHYGLDHVQGVPALLVIDPRTKRLINAGQISALSDARSMTAQAMVDWLARWI
jgi:thiol:disulfide interchange protein